MPILTPEERLGEVVADRYVLRDVLGEGGMGVVFEAEHRLSGRRVALKMLQPEQALGDEAVRRFLREARAAGQLEHPNVVEVLDVGVLGDGAPYLVLELLRGESLADYQRRKGRVAVERALTLLLPIMDALSEAHLRGIVHRDLKPDNVFLARHGDEVTPKLLDFGIAKVLGDTSTLRTRTGTVMGTPAYMAPEQARGDREIGPAVDQWALGVMMFEAITGELPFDGPSFPVLVGRILTQAPPRLSDRDEIPRAVAACVDRTLSRDPDDRYESVSDLALALRRAAESDGLDLGSRGGASRVDVHSAPPPDDEMRAKRPKHPSGLETAGHPDVVDALGSAPTIARPTPDNESEPASAASAPRPSPSSRRWAIFGLAGLSIAVVVVVIAARRASVDEGDATAAISGPPSTPESTPQPEAPSPPPDVLSPPAVTGRGDESSGDEERVQADESGERAEDPEARGQPEARPRPRERRTSAPRRAPAPDTVERPAPAPTRQPSEPLDDPDPMELRGW